MVNLAEKGLAWELSRDVICANSIVKTLLELISKFLVLLLKLSNFSVLLSHYLLLILNYFFI